MRYWIILLVFGICLLIYIFIYIFVYIYRYIDFSFEKKMKCYVVDGSWFLFRAYHAYPTLINDEWKNMNVVYGFFRILFKLMMNKPEYMLITWDLPVATKRHKMDTEYKANRPPIPDDFRQQIPVVHDIVKQLGIPGFGVPGYEADDVIATVVERIEKNQEKENIDIYIISSDKDLKQLLTENTVMLDPMRDMTHTVQSFQKEFGFEPKYMLDYLALIWDSADNIKWIPWIGPKTAIGLIQEYHTLENLYDHIWAIKPSTQKKLVEWRKSWVHSKRMIELMHVDVADQYVLSDFKLDPNLWLYRQTLINNYKFDSMSKILDDLKKKYQTPTQNSLF